MGDEVNRMACWIFVWSLVCEMFLSCGTEWYVERIVRTHPEPTVVARQVRAYEPATSLLRACYESATSLLRACYESATRLASPSPSPLPLPSPLPSPSPSPVLRVVDK